MHKNTNVHIAISSRHASRTTKIETTNAKRTIPAKISRDFFHLLIVKIVCAARLADSALHKKDVGVCTLLTSSGLGVPTRKISNAASPRQMNIQYSHVRTWRMDIHRKWTLPFPFLLLVS